MERVMDSSPARTTETNFSSIPARSLGRGTAHSTPANEWNSKSRSEIEVRYQSASASCTRQVPDATRPDGFPLVGSHRKWRKTSPISHPVSAKERNSKPQMVSTLLTRIFGNKHDRDKKKLWPVVDEINRYFESYRDLSDAELAAKTTEFKSRLAEGETLDDLLPEAFAAVKEACRRLVGKTWSVVGIDVRWDMVPYDVQLLGGVVLHQGRIAEMATGEGKTLVATMPLYLNALTGRGVHLV